MQRTRIKFCGFTRAQDVADAVTFGADAIGLVLVPSSKRVLTLEQAASLARTVPAFCQVVLLLQNADAEFVRAAIAHVRPDLLQFHGAEESDYCRQFGVGYLKAVPMRDRPDLSDYARKFGDARALLLDAHSLQNTAHGGGSGTGFDWNESQKDIQFLRRKIPIVLAGGLKTSTVASGIRALKPFAVDVASGIEATPGVKSQSQMHEFVAQVRQADAESQ